MEKCLGYISIHLETVLFVGDVTADLAQVAKENSKTAVLLDSKNYHKANEITIAYTSLGDLPNAEIFWQVLQKYDRLVYVKPKHWVKSIITKDLNDIQVYTEYLLYKINKQKNNVVGLQNVIFCAKNFKVLVDYRKTNKQQLWFVGCSFTIGKGVNHNQTYGHHLSTDLKMSASFLASTGSSIVWAADQILRSDIRKNDVVIWGLTEYQRFAQWGTDNSVKHLNSSSILRFKDDDFDVSKNVLLKNITSETLLYQAVVTINQVVNYCNKIGAKLLIVGFLSDIDLELALHDVSEFVQYSHPENHVTLHNWIDLGSDNSHPGPEQHKLFAEFCKKQLQQRNIV